MDVGFNATGATSVTGTAATFPAATTFAQLQSPPPPVAFDLAVTDALIGNVNSIDVAWDAVNAVPSPATTVLQLRRGAGIASGAGGGSGRSGGSGDGGVEFAWRGGWCDHLLLRESG